MPRTPDARDGPLYEEAVIWQEQSSDPVDDRRTQYVQGKGLVILEDGVVHGVGESRENVWQPPVDDRNVDIPPTGPETGDRVIVGTSPTGIFVGHVGEIAQWNGAAWVFTVPKRGTVIYVRDENEPYKQESASGPWVWTKVGTSGGLPTPTEVGQFLYSWDGADFYVTKPVIADDGFTVTDVDGHMVVTG